MARKTTDTGTWGAYPLLAYIGFKAWTNWVSPFWQRAWWSKAVIVCVILLVFAVIASIIADNREAARKAAHKRRLAYSQLNTLVELTPRQFEVAVGELLESMNYSDVVVTGGGGDLQADLTARSPNGERTIVQCKRYTTGKKINSPTVQTFIGMARVHHGANEAIIATTGGFTVHRPLGPA